MGKTHMLFEKNPYQRQTTARILLSNNEGVVLDGTVFYPTGGGQPGDTGCIHLPNGEKVRIIDTQRVRQNPSQILHICEAPIKLNPGTIINAQIDWERRYNHMRMHSCLHLLCSIVDAPVTGCSISADRGRLDFDLPEPTVDKEGITELLNTLIKRNMSVQTRKISTRELGNHRDLIKTRFLQPPELDGMVRLVDIDGIDTQPCGGTHVSNTSEIGAVRCRKIEKKSRHNRRIVIEFV